MICEKWEFSTATYSILKTQEGYVVKVEEIDPACKGTYSYEYDEYPSKFEVQQDHFDRIEEVAIEREKKGEKSPMDENKESIIEFLSESLKLTRQFSFISGIRYRKEGSKEYVYIAAAGETIGQINVTGDSGLAMLYDVIKALKEM